MYAMNVHAENALAETECNPQYEHFDKSASELINTLFKEMRLLTLLR